MCQLKIWYCCLECHYYVRIANFYLCACSSEFCMLSLLPMHAVGYFLFALFFNNTQHRTKRLNETRPYNIIVHCTLMFCFLEGWVDYQDIFDVKMFCKSRGPISNVRICDQTSVYSILRFYIRGVNIKFCPRLIIFHDIYRTNLNELSF